MKLLIVDDERLIIKGIKVLIEREKLNLEVFSANNGLEAFKIINEQHPDIIVTDVRMPIMDGLELCKKIQEEGITSRVIIISGYQDFHYAKKALEFGVKKYLLKPIQHKEFGPLLYDAVKELENAKIEKKTRLMNEELVKKKLLADLVQGINTFSSIIHRIKLSKLVLVQDDYVVALMAVTKAIEKGEKVAAGNHDEIKENNYTTVIDEKFNYYNLDKLYTEYKPHEFAFILQVKNKDIRPVLMMLRSIKAKFNTKYNIGCSIGLSRIHNTIDKIGEAIIEVHQAMNSSFIKGNSKISFFYDIEPKSLQNTYLIDNNSINIRLLYDMEYKLTRSLKNGNRKECEENIEFFFNELCKQEAKCDYIYISVLALILSLSKFINEIGSSMYESILGVQQITFSTLTSYKNVDDLKDFLRSIVHNIIRHIEDIRKNQNRDYYIISETKRIVGENIQNASLEYTANKIGISSVYLSSIFKEKTGTNFKQFLLETKMAYAKHLLLCSNINILQLSKKVGYSSSKHFSRMFKKITGVLPTEYKINRGL